MQNETKFPDIERLPPGDLVPYGRNLRTHIVRRWQDFTGGKAVLEESGERFDDLTAKRKAAQSEQG
jgi:hypothetical protein